MLFESKSCSNRFFEVTSNESSHLRKIYQLQASEAIEILHPLHDKLYVIHLKQNAFHSRYQFHAEYVSSSIHNTQKQRNLYGKR
jgi:hypothetical protein